MNCKHNRRINALEKLLIEIDKELYKGRNVQQLKRVKRHIQKELFYLKF